MHCNLISTGISFQCLSQSWFLSMWTHHQVMSRFATCQKLLRKLPRPLKYLMNQGADTVSPPDLWSAKPGMGDISIQHSHYCLCFSLSPTTMNMSAPPPFAKMPMQQTFVLGPVYTKRQRQRCDDTCDSVLIETMESLQIGVTTHFQATPLFLMRTEL